MRHRSRDVIDRDSLVRIDEPNLVGLVVTVIRGGSCVLMQEMYRQPVVHYRYRSGTYGVEQSLRVYEHVLERDVERIVGILRDVQRNETLVFLYDVYRVVDEAEGTFRKRLAIVFQIVTPVLYRLRRLNGRYDRVLGREYDHSLTYREQRSRRAHFEPVFGIELRVVVEGITAVVDVRIRHGPKVPVIIDDVDEPLHPGLRYQDRVGFREVRRVVVEYHESERPVFRTGFVPYVCDYCRIVDVRYVRRLVRTVNVEVNAFLRSGNRHVRQGSAGIRLGNVETGRGSVDVDVLHAADPA